MKCNQNLDFFIIGAMKSGTTSVHKHLCTHKDISLPPEKEAPFFSEDEMYKKGFDSYLSEYFPYTSNFTLRGTVTPQYMLSPKVPARIKETCPNAKLIAILRDPIERAYSHYHMATRVWGENETFNDAVLKQINKITIRSSRDEPNYYRDYIVFGEYGRILSKFYALFPSQQLLVLEMSELRLNPNMFMKRIFDFIGVDMAVIPNLDKKYHSSKINYFMLFIADISFNSRLRVIGKLLPTKLRRRVSFWLSLYRSKQNKKLNTNYELTNDVRKRLENIYRDDACLLKELTGNAPEWIKRWNEI